MPLVQSVHFSNYRNFTDFTMDGLQRVNLIVGDSNVGKTGLLEGLVALFGEDHQFASLPKTFRMSFGPNQTEDENYWDWFFPEKNNQLRIELLASYEASSQAAHQAGELPFSARINKISMGSFPVSRTQSEATYYIGGDSRPRIEAPKTNILPVGIGDYNLQVDLFNQLAQKKNAKEQLVESLKIIEPRLKSLEYLKLPSSGDGMVYADIDLEYKIPTTQFGHGFTRAMEMLSSLILSGSDIMIADEIENGIHYSSLGSVWKAILDYAVKNDVQVFATTHSRECIAAVHEAMQAQENYELNVIRLQNRKGEVVAINHTKEDIETAFDLGLPLR